MKPQIRELAEQAWESTRDEIGNLVDDGGEVNWDFLHIYDKKFAELIVRECMGITGKCSTGSGIHDLFADEIIAEHFGVEE